MSFLTPLLMQRRLLFLLSILSLLMVLAACGTPGAPQPPSLQLPKRVDDLKAVRKGDKVYLSWTMPTETTDGLGIKSETKVLITICPQQWEEMPDSPCDNKEPKVTSALGRSQAVDDISSVKSKINLGYLSYTLNVKNSRGRSAAASNAVIIYLAPSVPLASNVKLNLEPDAIRVQWTSSEPPVSKYVRAMYAYRVLRNVKGESKRIAIGQLPVTAGTENFADKDFVWEKTYEYHIVGITEVVAPDGSMLPEFEGDDTLPVEIIAHDVFPPAAPEALQAVFSGQLEEGKRFIDLTWSTNQENDLAGYNVYRRGASGGMERINPELVKAPAFRDANVDPGKSYRYSVTAVDLRGNESKHSAVTTEQVPNQQ